MDKLLRIALGEYGVEEFRGKSHNPIIVGYSHGCGFDGVIDDETAWCSIFINWCAKMANKERTNKLNARSWTKIGVEVLSPITGDIVVMWRESKASWKGHVGVFVAFSDNKDLVYVLGGNQDNKVCIKPYPTERVLSFKHLRDT